MDGLRSIIITINGVLQCMFLLGAIGTIAKLLISRKDKFELIKNTLDAIKYVVGYILLGYTTLITQSENLVNLVNITAITYGVLSITSVIIAEYIRKKDKK